MKNRILTMGLALSLIVTLTGCSDLLERSYTSSAAHVDRPTTAEDPSILRVENYRELVTAVLYLVSEGTEQGTIQLHDYAGSVESDLPAACVEVTTQDPLGAYCVDYIKHEYTRVLSDYEATLDIHYRRTQEQARSMVRVTGTGAIRTELREALSQFADQVVLRVAYFSGDEDFIAELIRQTYYETPAVALGYPEAEISLYPDSGRERVVEILLTYPESIEELRHRSEALADALRTVTEEEELPVSAAVLERPEEKTRRTLARLWSRAAYAPDGGATAYDALVVGTANDEGMALGYVLLDPSCRVAEGTLEEEPRFWIDLDLTGEALYLDPSEGTGLLYTAEELFDRGYRWPGGPQDPEETEPLAGEEKEEENGTETQ